MVSFNTFLAGIIKACAAPRVHQGKGVSQRGMTLIEIMVVLIIIGMIAGFVTVEIFGQLSQAQAQTAQNQIMAIGDSLDLYRLNNRRYPSTADGLLALVTAQGKARPIMESIPKDPWGQDYVYIYPGTQNTGKYDLMSYGDDGAQGGGDDVTNWTNNQ